MTTCLQLQAFGGILLEGLDSPLAGWNRKAESLAAAPTLQGIAGRQANMTTSELITKWTHEFKNTAPADMRYGWKALDPLGCTYYDGQEFQYTLPLPGQKWSAVTVHPDPAVPDGRDCDAGRLNVHNKPTYLYAPPTCWLWYVRYPKRAIVGASDEKTGVSALQLRRVSRKAFIRMIRLGWLARAHLTGANLERADLTGANLARAHLYGANLAGADLRGADLAGANLRGADLAGADLTGADLAGANNLDKALGVSEEVLKMWKEKS